MNERIRHLLYSLGVTANYTGFSYTVSAVELTAQDYDRLLMVTKWLYPEVASQFHTTMSCVERNIRTVAGIAWLRNPELLGRPGRLHAGPQAHGFAVHRHSGCVSAGAQRARVT